MRDIGRFVGRLIGAPSLVFWGCCIAMGLGGCAPAIPESGAAPPEMPAARDAGVGAPRGATGTPASPTSARTDAAASAPGDVSRGDAAGDASRADALGDGSRGDALGDGPRGDALGDGPRADAAGGSRGDAAGGDAGLTFSRPDASGDVSRGDAGTADAGAEVEPSDARPPRAGEIVIDEVLVDPVGNDIGHEWFEIVNVTSETLDLTTLHISDDVTDVAVDVGLLAPGGRLVLGQSLDPAHNGDAPVDRAYGTRLSLNNGADRVALCLGACADGLALDVFVWTAAWGDAYVGHAIVVAKGATCAAQDAYGTGGNFGTPGRPNPACPSEDDGGAD